MKDKNHYIQNRLLKNFAIQSDNGKYKICVMDLYGDIKVIELRQMQCFYSYKVAENNGVRRKAIPIDDGWVLT